MQRVFSDSCYSRIVSSTFFQRGLVLTSVTVMCGILIGLRAG